jgi:hypothetical protein
MLIPDTFSRLETVRPLGRAVTPTHECILDVAAPSRDFTEWCWAAVTVGIFTAYKAANREQCKIVKTFKACMKCCGSLSAADLKCCNKPNDLKAPLEDHCGQLHRKKMDHTEGFVKACIDNGFPIAVRIAWSTKSFHYVIIRGYRIMPDSSFEVHVSDPQSSSIQPTPIPFAEFRYNYEQDGEWDISYETQPHATKGLRKVPPLRPCF